MRKSKITQDVAEYIKANYMIKTYKEMADDLIDYGVTYDQIRYWMEKNNLQKPHSIFSKQDDEFIKNNYLVMSYEKMGQILGFTVAQLLSRIHYLGLKKYRTIQNESYFEKIDTSLKAYFLGYIYADGYISYKPERYYYRFGMKLQKQDEYIISKLNQELGGNCMIRYEEPCNKVIMNVPCHSSGTVQIIVHSKKIVTDLIKLNYLPNKTYKNDIPYIPNEYFWDWLRGYIDGDGSISYVGKHRLQLNITGNNKDLFNLLHDKLLSYGIETRCYPKGKETLTYSFCCLKTDSIKKIINFLYYDGCFCLQRKFEKAKRFYGPAA